MLFNLRGCNGAGKTYVVHEILKQYEFTYVQDRDEEIVATKVPELRLLLVGYYAPHELGTGGCDWYLAGNGGSKKNVQDLAVLLAMLELSFLGWNILFEGFMISGTYGRWSDFAQLHPTVFLCLDTPAEVCIEHIRGRRLRKGNTKHFGGENVLTSWRQVQRGYAELARRGHTVITVDYKRAVEQVHGILKGAMG